MKIGRYEIRKELGRGGMGVVHLAWDPVISREVALKLLELEGFSEDQAKEIRERFLREAKAAGRLNDPNIVTVYDVGEHEGESFIAMEYVRGRSLEDLLEEDALMSPAMLYEVIDAIAHALDHAHGQGIIHRDVKPANILLPREGGARVTDFGIARIENMRMTREGAMLGSPSYMSPEQVLGKELDGRSDIFSLGVILYIMITGEKPFPGDSMATLSYRIVQEDPTPPSQLNPALDARFDAVITKALAKNPAQRYQTAGQMAADIAEIVGRAPHGRKGPFIVEDRTRVSGKGKAGKQSLPTITAIPISDDTRVVRPKLPATITRKIGYAALALAGVIIVAWAAIWLHDRGALKELQNVLLATPVAKANEDNGKYRPLGIVPKTYILWRDANKAYRDKQYEKAKMLLTELSMVAHADEEVYLLLGKANSRLKEDSEAMDNYRKALQLDPEIKKDDELINDLIENLGKSRTYKEASTLLTDLVGDVAEERLLRAAADKDKRLSVNALKVLVALWSKRAKANPADADTLLAMARAYLKLGKGHEAIIAYRKALAIRPQERNNPHLALSLAGLLDGRSSDEARRTLVELVGPPAIPALLGILPDAKGRTRKNAIEALTLIYRKQMGNEPANANPAIDLAFLMIGEESYEPAWEAMSSALERDPGLSAQQRVIDALVSALGRPDGRAAGKILATQVGEPALPALKKALKSENRDIRWAAAKTLDEMGKTGEYDKLVLLEMDLAGDTACSVSRQAADELARTGDPKAREILKKTSQTPKIKRCAKKASEKALKMFKPL